MVKIQQIFDTAIRLMDEQDERSGNTITPDTDEYRFRTISILNTILPVLHQYDRQYDREKPVALLSDFKDKGKPDFDQYIPLEDDMAISLLPPFLAGTLLSSENDDLSAFFLGQYQRGFMDMRDQPSEFEPIYNPYGTF